MCSNDRHWKKKYMIPFSKSLDLNSKSMQIFHLDLIMLGRQTHTHTQEPNAHGNKIQNLLFKVMDSFL